MKGACLSYCLKQAEGKASGDVYRIYMAHPNGRKWESGWFIFPDPEILPVSTVFVPTHIEKEDELLPFLRDTAGILGSLAVITVALVQITK